MANRAGTKRKGGFQATQEARDTEAAQPPPPVGHNGPDDDLILLYVARIDAQSGVCEQAKAAHDAAKKGLSNIRQAAKLAGVKLKNLDAALEKRTLARHEQRSDVLEQDRYDRLLGNETWEAASLFDRVADASRDEVDVEADGYAAGLRGLPAKPPENLSPAMLQPWLRGHDRGAQRLMESLNKGPALEPNAAQKVREQAAADFAGDNDTAGGLPGDDGDPDGVAAAAGIFDGGDAEVDEDEGADA